MNRYFSLALGLGFALLLFATGVSAEPLILNDEQTQFPAGLHLMLLEDKEGAFTIEQVASPQWEHRFFKSTQKTPNFGFTTSVYWVKITLRNESKEQASWMGELSYPMLDYIDLYVPDGKGGFIKKSTGDQYPFAMRDITYHNFVYNINLAPGKERTSYLRIKTDSSMQLPLTIHNTKNFTEIVNRKQYFLGILYGIMLSMVIYNLFIYISVKDISYLHYVFFIISCAFFMMILDGLAYEYLWPSLPWLANRGLPIFEGFTLIFTLTFTRSYLNLRELQPKLEKLLKVLLGLVGLSIVVALFSYKAGVGMASGLAILAVTLVAISGIRGILSGYRPAIYFIVAWAAFLSGAMLFAMKAFGVIPSNALTDNFMKIGAALEVLLLSLGLADRINVMRKEKYLAEKTAREATQAAFESLQKADELKEENLRIIQEQNITLENKVAERTAAIRDLLDNTGQGFLTFGADHKIHKEYSKACENFFGRSLAEEDIVNLIVDHCSTHKAQEIREIFDMLLTGQSPLMLVEILLPKELAVGDKFLSIQYSLIESQSDPSDIKVMVILTDITQEVKLARQLKADEERQIIIVKVATDKNGFIRFLGELEELFNSTYHQLSGDVTQFDPNALFRNFHTIKGGAASYGLKKVAEKAHEAENLLAPIQRKEEAYTKQKQTELREATHQIENLLQSQLSDLNDILPPEERSNKSVFYRVSSDKILRLEDFLLQRIGAEDIKTIKREIEQLIAQPILPLLKKYASTAEELAARLGKSIKVEIRGGNTEVPFQKLEGFFTTLVHLVRNSVDHGLESWEEREASGKPDEGKLIIDAKVENGIFQIVIQDDGKGIDAAVIKKIALQKRLISEEQAEKMSENEALALIFAPGFSTKAEVTEVSGRGVGMDAVKTAVKALKGKISIQTKKFEGTSFAISIPLAS